MKLWLIVERDEYSLPVAVTDTLVQACDHLGISLETAKTSFKRHGYYKGKYFDIIKVPIKEGNVNKYAR